MYHQASQSGDYYRDTNLTKSGSNPNLRLANNPSMSNLSHHSMVQAQNTGFGSMSGGFGAPQIGAMPFVPFAGGPGSITGSDYGANNNFMGPMGGFPTTPSMYGMPMMNASSQMGFGGMAAGSQIGGFGGMAPPMAPGLQQQQRPMSTFSLATTMNPFAGPNMNENPTDDELFSALRAYLSTQDLMTVSKR